VVVDRSGLPLPELVSRLRNEFNQLREKVNGLPTESRVYKMDWEGSKGPLLGISGFVVIAALSAFGFHTCSVKSVEESRIAAQRSDSQDRLTSEREARNLTIAEHQAAADAERRGLDRAICTRACAAVGNMEVIRPSPCMCGGGGQLILFSEDYSTISRVQEVERLQPPPVEIGEEPDPEL
jgi:hypothetical protein